MPCLTWEQSLKKPVEHTVKEAENRRNRMEYGHGGDIYTYKDMLDFSVNVNPLGPSERVIEAAKRGVERADV